MKPNLHPRRALALSFRFLSETWNLIVKALIILSFIGTWSYEGSNSEFILLLCVFIAVRQLM